MRSIDRRTSPRIPVGVDVVLTRSIGGPVAGRTVDLGSGGMRIATARPLRVDEVMHFDLRLDTDHGVGGDVRVMRSHPRSEYALRFEHLAPAHTALLERYVALAVAEPAAASALEFAGRPA